VTHRRIDRASILLFLACSSCSFKNEQRSRSTSDPVNPDFAGVLTYHNDSLRTGRNLAEDQLSPANVNPTQFGKLGEVSVDGIVTAQPLYLPSVLVPSLGVRLNLLFVATSRDGIYAFDADLRTSAPIWQKIYIDPANGIVPVRADDVGFAPPSPTEIGILGTPVIDAATQTIYFVAKTKESGAFVQRLHAIDAATGEERPSSPVVITAKAPGTGYQFDDDARGVHYHDATDGQGSFLFNAQQENQRPALALSNGTVWIAWGAHGDYQPYHGWVLAYDSTTLAQSGAFSVSPNSQGGGIWMGGGGVAVDDAGAAFVVTGNGPFSYMVNGSLGDSLLKLSLGPSGLALADYFTPFNQGSLEGGDLDLASGGVLLIPEADAGGHRLAITGGKEGTLYVVDRDNMGQYHLCSNDPNVQLSSCDDTQIVQTLFHAVPGAGGRLSAGAGIYNTPAYWKGRVFVHAGGDVLKVFQLAARDGTYKLSDSPIAQGTVTFTQVGATISVSSSHDQNGVLWEVQQDIGRAVLHAYDADNYLGGTVVELYNNDMTQGRDVPGWASRFTHPVIANGRVYVPRSSGVDVYGLLASRTTFSFSLNASSFEPGLDTPVWRITGATPNATIYWSSTLNGAPSGESHVDYGTVTDSSGSFTFTGPPFTSAQAGQWTRTIQVGDQTATVIYRVYPSAISFTIDTHRAVGQTSLWTITGADPNSQIAWSSTINGEATGENDAYYGQTTDASGAWSGYGSAWKPSDVGHWVRKIHIGDRFKTVGFDVSPQPIQFSVDGNLSVGLRPTWTVSGANPQTHILWSSTLNGVDTGEDDADYGLVTDANGNWSGAGSAWRASDVGHWTRTIRIGDASQTIELDVTP
jgi:hypothetical protein